MVGVDEEIPSTRSWTPQWWFFQIICTLQLIIIWSLKCLFCLAGRAAMIGFFMAYFVDSLTGVGLVDQMGNFFCKTLLFVAVAGVLFIRKNEDLDKLKGLIEETTLYDKQWQAAWKEPESSSSTLSSKKWTKTFSLFVSSFLMWCLWSVKKVSR